MTFASVTGNSAFDYAPGQPNLHRMMLLKQRLMREFAPDEAFQQYRRTFGWPESVSLDTLMLRQEDDFAQQHGVFHRETARAGQRFEHAPPRIIGAGRSRPIRGSSRSHYVACLRGADLRGRSGLIRIGDNLLIDRQATERNRLDDEIEWDPVIFSVDGDRVRYITAADATTPIEVPEAFSLLGCHTDFFGHWMSEYLTKYLAAVLSNLLPKVPVLVDAHMPPSHREALELFADEGITFIEVPAFRSVRVARLWCSPTLMYMPLHELQNQRFEWEAIAAPANRFEPVLRHMAQCAESKLPIASEYSPRLYLARKDIRHRKLLNDPEISGVLANHGFYRVFPEDLPFRKQVALVRQANWIVAAEGSALFLAYVAAPGTRLAILSHELVDALAEYNGTLGARGIAVVALTGPIKRHSPTTPQDSDYEIDSKALGIFLDDWATDDRHR